MSTDNLSVLLQVKVVKFLGSGMMEPMEVALLLVVAAADTRDDYYVETHFVF